MKNRQLKQNIIVQQPIYDKPAKRENPRIRNRDSIPYKVDDPAKT
jgi:hypothetical protein